MGEVAGGAGSAGTLPARRLATGGLTLLLAWLLSRVLPDDEASHR